jgi:arsenate reductase (thioredoxin)
VEGSEVEKLLAFRKAFRELENRIRIFVNLPLGSLDSLRLQERLDEIGRTRGRIIPVPPIACGRD